MSGPTGREMVTAAEPAPADRRGCEKNGRTMGRAESVRA
jgi:hypothetical protein